MPDDVREFLADEARRNCTSQNAEFVRSVRERMGRTKPTTGESLQANAPAAGPNDTALKGGPIIHG
ncbi:hypothetical protein [Methylorubrum extorquens]